MFSQIIIKHRSADSDSESLTSNELDGEDVNNDIKMDLIDQSLEGITEHVSSKRIILNVIEEKAEVEKLMEIVNVTLKESEFWAIDIDYYDPFNQSNATRQGEIFGKRKTMSRHNPLL